jgi:hypothetical protein
MKNLEKTKEDEHKKVDQNDNPDASDEIGADHNDDVDSEEDLNDDGADDESYGSRE